MMNIFYVIPSLETGGAELQTINHVNYLHKNDINVSVVLLKKNSENTHLLLLPKSNIFCLNSIDKSYLTLSTVRKSIQSASALKKVVEKYKPTHIISILPISHIICRLSKFFLLLRHFKTFKLITYYRDIDYESTPLNTFQKKLFNYFNSFLARYCDNSSIFISEAVHENISKNIFVKKSLIIPNSLPENVIPKDKAIDYLKSKNIDHTNQFIILIPSRLHINKGHELFIETFKRFNDTIKNHNIFIIIAGSGPEKEKIRTLIKSLYLEDFFFLAGRLENKLLLSLYALVNLTVIPSILEGFGNVAIEGLKQKSLMLTSNAGGLDKIIIDGYNGFKFKKNDSYSLYERLEYIYKNKKLIDMSNLEKDFKEKYTLKKQMEDILHYI